MAKNEYISNLIDDVILEHADMEDSVIRHAFRLHESGTITRGELVQRITDREHDLAPLIADEPTVKPRTPHVVYGRNEHFLRETEMWAESLLVRDGVLSERECRTEIDPYLTCDDIATKCLRRHHMHVPSDKAARAEAAMKMGNGLKRSGVDDFAAVMSTTANKTLTLSWINTPETWPFITRPTETSNFLQFERHTAPEAPTPELVKENGEVKRVQLGSGTKETAQVATYAHINPLSRYAVINDDLSAVTTNMQAEARACSRLVGDLVYAVLTGNPAMADGFTFFDGTNHGNVAAVGSAPSVTAINTIRRLMSAQAGPTGEILNIRPAILVGPTSLESTLCVLRSSSNANEADDPLTPGYRAGRLSVVTDQRLDADSEVKWYCTANPRQFSGIEVVTLQGSRCLPLLEQMTRWVSDAIEWRTLFDVAVVPVDYRTWVYNPGA